MTTFDPVSAAAVLAMVGGLVAVLWEILAKNPRALVEMAGDSRRFAEAPLAAVGAPASRSSADAAEAAAKAEHPRLAA
jgi:hypothetical protein